jgi:hypothetical protein
MLKIGAKVKYCKYPMKEYVGDVVYTIIDVIPNGLSCGGGETNKSGKDIYRLEGDGGVFSHMRAFADELEVVE